ncbi:hypothetical protein ACDN41_11655 [Priestia aryabhattai]|uniref:hypothetical protein n=1 Tax=Priestia aryabhattai TaxID=412384 RepID=UPI003531C852
MRRTQVLEKGIWKDISFKQLYREADFRIYDENNILVKDSNGNTEFHATSNPYYSNAYECWMINTY